MNTATLNIDGVTYVVRTDRPATIVAEASGFALVSLPVLVDGEKVRRRVMPERAIPFALRHGMPIEVLGTERIVPIVAARPAAPPPTFRTPDTPPASATIARESDD